MELQTDRDGSSARPPDRDEDGNIMEERGKKRERRDLKYLLLGSRTLVVVW